MRIARLAAALLALASGGRLAAQATAVLKITQVPAFTPSTDSLFVAGSFNSWNPHNARYALHRNIDGSYQLALPGSLGAVEFKITRGSWQTVETAARSQPLPNLRADLSGAPTLTLQVAGWQDQGSQQPATKKTTASAQVRVLARDFAMPQLGRTRRVLVYLPADYARQPTRRYPVLYLHDGQNVFDELTSFSGEWGIDETLDRLRAAGQDATGSIVVAVDNGQQFRSDEYIPWRSAGLQGQPHQGGQGAQYVDFLARTLKPYVDAHYRTRPEAAHTGIAGSSLGGLISVYAALKYPKVFGEVGAFSPAFWVCNDSLRAFARQHPAARTARFYFVCGPKESETMLPLMAEWRDELRAEGVPAASISFHAPPDGEHKEWFWRREFPAAYRFLFGGAVQQRKAK